MQPMMLNISMKQYDPNVKYPFRKKTFCYANGRFIDADFLEKNIVEEVRHLSRKKLKKFRNICLTSLMTFGTLVLTGNFQVFAEPVTGMKELDSLPTVSEIMKIGLYLVGICGAISTILAIILTQLVGNYRMLQRDQTKYKEATRWTTEILKGYTQVLLAPVIIITIAFIAYLLFSNVEWFVTPF